MTNQNNPQPMGNSSSNNSKYTQSEAAGNSYNSTIETLQLWWKYRYMFRNTFPRIEVRSGCFVIYENLCHDIDALLGEDKRGFEWTKIADEDGTPVWHWCLSKCLDLKLAATVSDQSLKVAVKYPAGDPESRLRRAITLRVNAARAAARFMANLIDTSIGGQ